MLTFKFIKSTIFDLVVLCGVGYGAYFLGNIETRMYGYFLSSVQSEYQEESDRINYNLEHGLAPYLGQKE